LSEKMFQELQSGIKANQFRIEMLNARHSQQCVEILAHAFSRGGGNYEVINNLDIEDMRPIARSWIDLGIRNGLSFVLLDEDNNVAFVGINEVIGYDENTSVDLTKVLSKNGRLRMLLRHEFERNDPFWQKLMRWKRENKLKYGSAMCGIGASRPDLQGHVSLSTLALRFWGLFLRNLYNQDILKYYVSDATHWKTIALQEYGMKEARKVHGAEFMWKSSSFDVNEFVKAAANKEDFVYNPKVQRKMNMYVTDFEKGAQLTWKQELQRAVENKQFVSNATVYEKSKL